MHDLLYKLRHMVLVNLNAQNGQKYTLLPFQHHLFEIGPPFFVLLSSFATQNPVQRTLYYQLGKYIESIPCIRKKTHTHARYKKKNSDIQPKQRKKNLHNQLKNYFQLDGRKFVVIIMVVGCSFVILVFKIFKRERTQDGTFLTIYMSYV